MKADRNCLAAAIFALAAVNVQAQDGNAIQLPSVVSGIELPAHSHGIAVEMGHWNSVFGTWKDKQSVGFLQLLRNLHDRRGALMIRLGGNSQDAAYADETITEPVAKTGEQAVRTNSGATTWNIKVNHRMFHAMRQLSEVVGGLKWMVGLNFEHPNDITNAQQLGRLAVDTLGGGNRTNDNILYALQIGNEPDLYSKHGMRAPDWGVAEYTEEWLGWAQHLSSAFGTSEYRPDLFSGGVVCCTWGLKNLLDSGYIERAKNMLNSITVQRYSSNACFGVAKGTVSDFLSHEWITSLPRHSYEEPIRAIIEQGKEVIMGETNTAACGGIEGISDTFVSALWWVDWQMFLYSLGFSSIQLQLGGSSAHYNPMSKVGGSWLANPIYYGSLVTAEALGPTDARPHVVHVAAPTDQQVVYAVFHHDRLAYAVLINLDPNNDATFPLQHSWDATTLHAKRMIASSVGERHDIRWAGQTLRGSSNGTFKDDVQIDSIKCADALTCAIPVPKGSVALVGPQFPNIHETSIIDDPYDIAHLLNGTSKASPDDDKTDPLTKPNRLRSGSHRRLSMQHGASSFAVLIAIVYHALL